MAQSAGGCESEGVAVHPQHRQRRDGTARIGHEFRRYYREDRFVEFGAPTGAASPRDHLEMWFAGAHIDVGGRPPGDHRLSDIALSWMVKEAHSACFLVDEKRYSLHFGCRIEEDLPVESALGGIHLNSTAWLLLGRRRRPVRPNDRLHASVLHRIEATANGAKPYRWDLRQFTGHACAADDHDGS
jgi:hypothetical protein